MKNKCDIFISTTPPPPPTCTSVLNTKPQAIQLCDFQQMFT